MSTPDPEHLLALLEDFINAPTWAESRRIVEGAPELLTDEADALLDHLLAQYREDDQAVRILGEHRDLLRRCRAEGVEAAFADRQDADPEETLRALLERAESDPQARAALEEMQRQAMAHPLMQALQVLIETCSPTEVLAVTREHPALLSEEGLAFVQGSIETARQVGQEEMARHIGERYETLREMYQADAVPERLDAIAEAMPPGLRERLDSLAGAAAPPSRDAISYTAPWPHSCPNCGHRWQPEVWQIVDAAEHPDLVECIHDGTLHNTVCPSCGQTSEVEAPLMIHNQEEERLLLAVPEAWSEDRAWQENWRLFSLLLAGLDLKGVLPAYLERTQVLDRDLDLLGRTLQGEVDETIAVPPELRAMVERLGPELGRQLLDIVDRVSSQEEFEAEVDRHPRLREALAQTSVSAGPGLDDVPAEIVSIVQELIGLTRRADMPRRIDLCQQALHQLDRERNPVLWALLQNALANSLVQTPGGERAENFERAIHHSSQALEVYTRQDFPADWALTQNNLALAYAGRIRGERAENLERAIYHSSQALEVYTRQAFPADWALTQDNLALAYAERIRGERAQNLERAIYHYSQAMEVRTRQAFPADWAGIQNNLATAYAERIRGERAENLERAIYHYSQALEVYTPQADPAESAGIQIRLALAYAERIRGERAENLERAIYHYTQALEVRTRQAFPADWAGIQNNLATAYAERIRGERAENLERAIYHYSQALEVYTRQADPAEWAGIQNNLANTHRDRLRGERAENLERAIYHYSQALEVYTRQAFPAEWAMTQNNLATAYADRIRGERAENLERAIYHYIQALEVRSRQAFPVDWAGTQNNLGIAYAERIRGERAENLEQAIHYYSQALEVYTRQADPEHWALTQNNLAGVYAYRIRGERAENLERAIYHYSQALEVYTPQAFPAGWAMTQSNLATAYADRIRGERAENLEQAIHCFSRALEVYTRQAEPERWALTQNNLALTYAERIRGERAENLERAVFCFHRALEFYTPEAWPERARDVSRRLGSAHFAARNWPSAHAAFAQAQALTEQFYAAALLREVQEQEAGTNAAMYAQDAFCLARLGDLPAAWTSLETGRARALRQGLDRARARRALAAADPTLRERYELLTGRERAFRDALQRSEDDTLHQAYHLIRDELASLREELDGLQEELLTIAGIETGLPSSEEVQALPLLQDGRTGMLSLAVTEHGTLALLLTGQGLRQTVVSDLTEADLHALIWGLDEDPEPGGWLGAYLAQFEALRALRDVTIWTALMPDSQERRRAAEEAHAAWQAARERWQDTIAETLTTLGRRLWPPLDRMLQNAGCERVVLVPQGRLFLLPLHACPLNEVERVCDRYTVAYAPAGTILSRLVQEETPAGTPQALLVANPTGDLRHTPSEALAVGQTFDNPVTLWEQEATQARLIDAARDADVLHVSGHGLYDWLEPERSGLVLAAEGAAGERGYEWNLFTVAEMRDELRLSRARLVTLSACETGLVELRRGLADEYLGLPGILLQDGARAVVASLWAVDDLATTLLMRRFYTEWQAGSVSIAAALQRAQAWLRTRSRAQVEEALDELDGAWEPWRHQDADPAMKRRAVEQYWEILAARRRLRDEMPDSPFAHPYWWAAFQAVGDVL